MSMLNFRHGSYKNLFNTDGSNKLAINNGTVYVTTDEHAMYVDLNDTRIRLGQIITVTTEEWQQLTPPYSMEAFYYLSDSYALLKYNSKGEWVQLNSTSELSSALEALTTRVGTAEGKIVEHTNAINGVNASIEQINTTLGTTTATANSAKATAEAALPKAEFTTWRDGTLADAIADAKKAGTDATGAINAHAALTNNPHQVTKDQVGLDKVDNTADADKPVSTAQAEAIATAKNAVLGTSGDESTANTVYGAKKAAAEALTAANNVNTALNAYEAANDAVIAAIKGTDTNFDSFDDVKAKLENTYATKVYAENQAKAVLGTEDDEAGDNTVHGANKAAAAAQAKAVEGVNAAAANTLLINSVTGQVSDILKDANASMTTFKAVYDAIEGVKANVNALDDTYATDTEVANAITAAKTAVLGEANYGQTVKSAYTLANTANQTANAAVADIADIKNGTEIDSFADVETKISGVQTQIDNLDNTYAKDTELTAAKEAILGAAGYGQTVKSAYELADSAKQLANSNQGAISDIVAGATVKTFAGVEGEIAKVQKQIDELDNTYATDAQLASAVSAAKTELTQTINGVDAKVEKNILDIAANAGAIEDLDKRLTTEIQTADALVYVGTISTAILPTENVKVGHTYKVTTDIAKTDFTNVNFESSTADDTMVHAGDLLIAKGTETDGVITSGLTWDHIPSGYHAEYVPEMTTVFENKDGVVSASVKLTSAHAATGTTGDLGAFTVVGADGSAITVHNNSNNTIAIGMTWGTF